MNETAIRNLIVLALCAIAAVVFGSIVASQSYENLILLAYLVVGIYVLVAPGFAPLVAFGLLNPFVLPLPLIWNVPFMLIILGICCVKFFFYQAVNKQPVVLRHCFTWATAAFFGWVVLRYCLNPVRPNASGFGENITGFRSYLNYGVCFGTVLLFPFFFTKREDLIKVIRWIGGISLFFVLLLIPFVFSKSLTAALWLGRFGLFVAPFENGMLRFVVLSGFGLNLLTLSLLPNIVPVRRWMRVAMAVLGGVAMVVGANRSTLVMALVVLATIALIRRRTFMLTGLVVGSIVALAAFDYIGERVDISGGVGFLRILSLGSDRLARESGAADTMVWRMIRWKRAMTEIQAHPIIGKGYGGLENAWLWSDIGEFEEARVEADLASGGIHNGFLNAAYSLGIPAVLFFVISIGGEIFRRFKAARDDVEDPIQTDAHIFVCANLAALLPTIYIGIDLNTPIIWFFIAMGAFLMRTKPAEPKAAVEEAEEAPMPLIRRRLPV